jgi:hypothetical protein
VIALDELDERFGGGVAGTVQERTRDVSRVVGRTKRRGERKMRRPSRRRTAPSVGSCRSASIAPTHAASSGKRIDWYGDFVSADDGSVQRDVPLENNSVRLHVGQSIDVTVLGANQGRAFATSRTWEWLPFLLFGAVFALLAALPAWLLVHHCRRPRARP